MVPLPAGEEAWSCIRPGYRPFAASRTTPPRPHRLPARSLLTDLLRLSGAFPGRETYVTFRVLSHPGEVVPSGVRNRNRTTGDRHGRPSRLLRQRTRRQGPEAHQLGGQGGVRIGAAARHPGTGEDPCQPDQRLRLLHRHAHQGRRPRRGDRPAPPPRRRLARGHRLHRGRTRRTRTRRTRHPYADAAGASPTRHGPTRPSTTTRNNSSRSFPLSRSSTPTTASTSSTGSPPATTGPASSADGCPSAPARRGPERAAPLPAARARRPCHGRLAHPVDMSDDPGDRSDHGCRRTASVHHGAGDRHRRGRPRSGDRAGRGRHGRPRGRQACQGRRAHRAGRRGDRRGPGHDGPRGQPAAARGRHPRGGLLPQ